MDLYKSLVFDTIMWEVTRRLISRFPVFGMFPLNIFLGWMVGLVGDNLYLVLKSFDVKLENAKLRREFDISSVELKVIAMEKGIESDEFKKAREAHKQKLSDFARLTIFK